MPCLGGHTALYQRPIAASPSQRLPITACHYILALSNLSLSLSPFSLPLSLSPLITSLFIVLSSQLEVGNVNRTKCPENISTHMSLQSHAWASWLTYISS